MRNVQVSIQTRIIPGVTTYDVLISNPSTSLARTRRKMKANKHSDAKSANSSEESVTNKHSDDESANSSEESVTDGDEVSIRSPPKCAIANGFAVGRLPPALRQRTTLEATGTGSSGSTEAEISLLTPVRHVGYIRVVKGYGQSCMKGHCYAVKLDTKVVLEHALPHVENRAPFRVLVTGKISAEQKRKLSRYALVRRTQVQQLWKWFRSHNDEVYSEIVLDDENLDLLPDNGVSPSILQFDANIDPVGNPASNSGRSAPASATPGKPNDIAGAAGCQTANSDPGVLLMTHSTYVTPMALNHNALGEDILKATNNIHVDPTAAEYIHIRSSSEREPDWDPQYIVRVFPNLFPFGRGGPGEHRDTNISFKACFEHYLRTSTGAFQNPKFVLRMYNIVARRNASQSAYTNGLFQTSEGCTRAERYASLDKRQLKLCIDHMASCRKARMKNRSAPDPPAALVETGVNRNFVQSITTSCAAMPHTDAAVKEARIKIHSSVYHMGKPQLFLTVNPDDGCSIDVYQMATGDTETKQMPKKILRYNLLSRCPGAAALSFEKVVHVLLETLLQWDIKGMKPKGTCVTATSTLNTNLAHTPSNNPSFNLTHLYVQARLAFLGIRVDSSDPSRSKRASPFTCIYSCGCMVSKIF